MSLELSVLVIKYTDYPHVLLFLFPWHEFLNVDVSHLDAIRHLRLKVRFLNSFKRQSDTPFACDCRAIIRLGRVSKL